MTPTCTAVARESTCGALYLCTNERASSIYDCEQSECQALVYIAVCGVGGVYACQLCDCCHWMGAAPFCCSSQIKALGTGCVLRKDWSTSYRGDVAVREDLGIFHDPNVLSNHFITNYNG